ncbi:MAG TPA: hypothetical protein DCP53_06745 [Elusimicrobia bacterium]|nr:hypothetical protein [Elusimicrobiota bacterium]
MKTIIKLSLIFVMFLSVKLFAITRDDIILRASPYLIQPWNCTTNNIKDEKTHYKEKPPENGSDGDDDRAWKLNKETQKWEYSTNNWPFEVGASYPSVAYAYGMDNTFSVFQTNIANGYIAGKMDLDTSVPTGKSGYTGIDCAEFVEEMWVPGNTNDIHSSKVGSTYGLVVENYDLINSGDALYDPKGHIVLVKNKLNFSTNNTGTVTIIHAAWLSYITGNHMRRVIEETTNFKIENNELKLYRYGSYMPHTPYTAFPILTNDFYPKEDVKINEDSSITVPIKLTVKSKLSINSVIMKINNGPDITPKFTRTSADTVYVTYETPESLSAGTYDVSFVVKNVYGLEESGVYSFKVTEISDEQEGDGGDRDNDGMPDEWENENGLNPDNPLDANADSDSDGLTNLEEYCNGTNPLVSDTDSGGVDDKTEIANGTNPINNPEDDSSEPPPPIPPVVPPSSPPSMPVGYPISPFEKYLAIVSAVDPNIMYGPEGYISAGQNLTYTVEFENIGEGIAYGVYVTDVLPEGLDESSLIVSNFRRIDYNNNIETLANFEYKYNSETRLLTVFVDNYGEIGSKQGGKFDISVRVNSNAQPGTVIANYATVYFPSVPEETRTNTIFSVIPKQTCIYNSTRKMVNYSDTLEFSAILTDTLNNALSDKPVNFYLGNSSYTVITGNNGLCSALSEINLLPGEYSIKIEYPGDGFYYLPCQVQGTLKIIKEKIEISKPEISILYPGTTTLMLTMTDDEGLELLHQEDEPKTVILEYWNGDNWQTITQSTLVKSSVTFEFSFPEKPSRLSYYLKARFEGDNRYESSDRTGVLTIIDNDPPVITINSPKGGERFVATVDKIDIDYNVNDLSQFVTTGYLTLVECPDTSKIGIKVIVNSGDKIEPLNLPYYGFYTMTVEAMDTYKNYSSSTTPRFEVMWDNKPPQSQYTVHGKQYTENGSAYITSETHIELSAVDDLVEVDDGIGLGVKEIKYRISATSTTETLADRETSADGQDTGYPDGSGAGSIQYIDFIDYAEPIKISGEGIYTVEYYAIDIIGNTELTKLVTFYVDNTTPESEFIVSGSEFIVEDKIFISSETEISLTATDPEISSGIAGCGVKYTEYKIDSGPYTIALSPATKPSAGRHYCTIPLSTLSEGEHTIYYHSYDNLLNQELEKSLTITIDNSVPETFATISDPKFPATDGTGNYITSNSVFKLVAIDSGTIPSGIKETVYSITDSTYAIPVYIQYNSTFNVTDLDGIYTFYYYSTDNVNNIEHPRIESLKLDNTPPQSQLEMQGIAYSLPADGSVEGGEGKVYINSETEIIITAEDPITNRVTSGLKGVYYSIDTNPYTLTSNPYTLTLPEGIHTIKYYAEDNVGNLETIKEQTYYVDTTPPVTSINTTEIYITPDTPLSFTAIDPISNSVASGISKTEYSIDNGSYSIYTTSFTLAVGTHTITYRSIDNVLNIEILKSAVFTVTEITKYAALGIEGITINGQSKIYGDVRSNSQIKLTGQSLVDGNAEAQKITIVGQSKITGTKTQNAEPVNPYTIDLDQKQAEISQNNDNSKIPLTSKGKQALINGVLTLSGQDSLTISTGTYFLSGISLSGQAKLNLNGEIQMLCIGKIQISGQCEVHYTGDPYKLKIYCNTAQPIQIGGQGELMGIIYAPYSDVSINGQGITLSNVIAKSIDINGQSKIVGINYKEKPISFSSLKQAPSAAFVKGEVYAYPNPAKNGYQPTMHIECGIADSVEIRIYNIAGELVHEGEIYTQPIIKNGKYAYEYTWDISDKASGVYLYLIKAHKTGEKTIKVLKKIAIIK